MKFYINAFVAMNRDNMTLLATEEEVVKLGAFSKNAYFDSYMIHDVTITFTPRMLNPTDSWWMTKHVTPSISHRIKGEIKSIHKKYTKVFI